MCAPDRKGVGGIECVDGHSVARGVLRHGGCALAALSFRILSLAPADQILEGRKYRSRRQEFRKNGSIRNKSPVDVCHVRGTQNVYPRVGGIVFKGKMG